MFINFECQVVPIDYRLMIYNRTDLHLIQI